MSFKPIRYLSAFALLLFSAACSSDSTAPVDEGTPPGETPPPPATDVFLAGARAAWTYVENNTNSTTGLAGATETFKFATRGISQARSAHLFGAERASSTMPKTTDGSEDPGDLNTMRSSRERHSTILDIAGQDGASDFTPSRPVSVVDHKHGRLLIWPGCCGNHQQYSAQQRRSSTASTL